MKKEKSNKIKIVNVKLKDLKIKDEDFINGRFKDYIRYGIQRVEYYENLRRKYLDITIYLTTLIITLITFILRSLIDNPFPLFWTNIIFISGWGFPIIIFFYNLFYFLREKGINIDFKDYDSVLWFYRGNVPERKNFDNSSLDSGFISIKKKFESWGKDDFFNDDIVQIYYLYCYQSHRYNLSIKMRKILIVGIFSFIIPIVC